MAWDANAANDSVSRPVAFLRENLAARSAQSIGGNPAKFRPRPQDGYLRRLLSQGL